MPRYGSRTPPPSLHREYHESVCAGRRRACGGRSVACHAAETGRAEVAIGRLLGPAEPGNQHSQPLLASDGSGMEAMDRYRFRDLVERLPDQPLSHPGRPAQAERHSPGTRTGSDRRGSSQATAGCRGSPASPAGPDRATSESQQASLCVRLIARQRSRLGR